MRPVGGKKAVNDYENLIPGSMLIGKGSSYEQTHRALQEGISIDASNKLQRKMLETLDEKLQNDAKRKETLALGRLSDRMQNLPRLRNQNSLPSKSVNVEGSSVYGNMPIKQGLF